MEKHGLWEIHLSIYNDQKRFQSPWISKDSDFPHAWTLPHLGGEGYFTNETDGLGETLEFLRVQEQTLFVSETTNPIESTWENNFYFYNFRSNQWDKKMSNRFTIPASRKAVRAETYTTGGGIWAGMLESHPPPDIERKTPVKNVVYRNRSIRIIDNGITNESHIDASMNNYNNWDENDKDHLYRIIYKSTNNYDEYIIGVPRLNHAAFSISHPQNSNPFPTLISRTTNNPRPQISSEHFVAKKGTLVANTQVPLLFEGKLVGLMTLKAGAKVTIVQVLPNGFIVSHGEGTPFKVVKDGLKLNDPE